MTCTIEESRRFFASICFASQHLAVFETVLGEICERDWPSVFLASIIIENCGLKRIKHDLQCAAQRETDPFGFFWHRYGTKEPLEETNEPSTQKNKQNFNDLGHKLEAEELWVEVPNQYILRDSAWLFPVIRACDPEKIAFRDQDPQSLLADLCHKLAIDMRRKDAGTIEVNLTHSIKVIKRILANPGCMGVSAREVESVLRCALDDFGYEILNQSSHTIGSKPAIELNYDTDTQLRELERALLLLAVLLLSFVASGLISGYLFTVY